MKIKRIIAFITFVCMAVCLMQCTSVFALAESTASQSSDSAFIDFSNLLNSRYLTFVNDSMGEGQSPLQFEDVTKQGISGKKISGDCGIYLDVNTETYYPSKWSIIITYYDEGQAVSDFYVNYKTQSGTNKLTVRKTAMKPGWKTASLFVDDAVLNGGFEYDSDIIITASESVIVSKIEIVDLSFSGMSGAGKITPTTVNDSNSGRSWQYISFDSQPALRPYVTAQGWNYEGTKFIFSSYTSGSDYRLYEYDTVNRTVCLLDTGLMPNSGALVATVTPDNFIYYSKSDGYTWKIDWTTYEKQKTNAIAYESVINVTNDGRWISGYGGENNLLYRSNTITGETQSFNIDRAYSEWSSKNNILTGKGHPMINPEYPHLLFFCHEGDTTIVPDRLWLANFDTNDLYNMFVQAGSEGSVSTKETSGHEVWSMDGEMMYWVKYTFNQNSGQSGLMRMDKFGSNREYINHDYNFWHCYPSSDHNFVVGDTNTNPTNIAIVDTNSYKSTLLAGFALPSSTHPNQPHPQISYNSYAVSWQIMVNKVTCIGWDEVRDITANPKQKQIIPFGDDAELITCEGAVSETSTEAINGVTYRKAEAGKGIYINILNKVCKNANADVAIEVEYLDSGSSPINIVCTAGASGRENLADRENKTFSIAKTNSGDHKKAVVSLGKINANDIGRFMSDLYFTTSDEATFISSVKVHEKLPNLSKNIVNKKISTTANKSGDYIDGLQCTALANYPEYNNTLYHVDDTQDWSAGGITQETVNTAISNGYQYVTLQCDGAWKYEDYTDSLGETRTAFYAPNNYRQNGNNKKITGNIYFRLLDGTIDESDNEVTFVIDYLDGADIKVTYISTSGMSYFTIRGTGTNKWKRTSVTVSDAKLSASNSETKLASGFDDIKVESMGSRMYISGISVQTIGNEVKSGMYADFVYQDSTGGSSVIYDMESTKTVAKIYNETENDRTAFAATVVYAYNGIIRQIAKTDNILIPAGRSVTATTPAVSLDSGEWYYTYVWETNLSPAVRLKDKLDFRASKSADGGIVVEYDTSEFDSECFYNIFCNGELVLKTQTESCTFTDVAEGVHTYRVDVTDKYGGVVYRSRDIFVEM